MRKTLTIFFSCLMMCLNGCVTDFDMGLPTAAKLCLICYPGSRDTTVIQLYKTVPVGGRYDSSPYLQSADITFSVNGINKRVEWAEAPVGSVPQGCWFVPGRLEGRAEVEMSANAKPVEPVYASTRIPQTPPEFICHLEAGDWTELSISFEDPLTDDYYGVAVVCEWTIANVTGQITEVKHLSPAAEGLGTHEIAIIRDYYDICFTGWSLWPKRTSLYGVRVWQDTKFNGKKVDLTTRFEQASLTNSQALVQDCRYKVRLYSFTEEFFKYMSALDYQEHNEYASYGIIPMKLSYTNIAGGCGILAGWSMRESEWLHMD